MERDIMQFAWRSAGRPRLPLPMAVRFTRRAPGRLDRFDNVADACKALKDEVARIAGVDDDDPRITWLEPVQYYSKTPSVTVEVWKQ